MFSPAEGLCRWHASHDYFIKTERAAIWPKKDKIAKEALLKASPSYHRSPHRSASASPANRKPMRSYWSNQKRFRSREHLP
jgi:hypothetical protein